MFVFFSSKTSSASPEACIVAHQDSFIAAGKENPASCQAFSVYPLWELFMDNSTETVSATQMATQHHKEYYRVNRNTFAEAAVGKVGVGGNMHIVW